MRTRLTRVLGDRRTTFVVVSTLESAPFREAQYFISELRSRDLHLGAVVFNKVLPGYLLDREATLTAQRLCAEPDVVAGKLVDGDDPAVLERVLREVGNSFLNFQVVANREAETRTELSSIPDVVANVPYFDTDIYDLSGLIRLGDKIWR